LATSNGLGLVNLFELPSLRPISDFRVSTGAGNKLAFSPDGTRLAVTTSDGLKVWDLRGRQELLSLDCEFGSQIEFSPAGNFLVVRTWKGILNIWRAPPWPEIAAMDEFNSNLPK